MSAAPELPLRATPLEIPRERRVYVNRNLRMDSITMVGFDMDYTLALYRQDALHALSVELTLDKLIAKKGYPREIARLEFDPQFAIRGLRIDTELGHIFKQDRHGHVGRTYHGRRRLSRPERAELYRSGGSRYGPPRFAWIDHLFALPEAVMYAGLVDHFDGRGRTTDYARLWADVRECIDEAHRDDTLKSRIRAALTDYIVSDPELPLTLHKLRSSGKRLFLLTNSWFDYTDTVMSYLLDGKLPAYPTWRNYFDLVCVAAEKPRFFQEARAFVELDAHGQPAGEARALQRGRVYTQGSFAAFEAMAGAAGDRILYVGDHIYGDMLRSKKASAWRTAMILQELEDELRAHARQRDRVDELEQLDRERARLEAEVGFAQRALRALQRAGGADPEGPAREAARREAKAALDRLRVQLRELNRALDELEEAIDLAFNPYWGPVFKEGNENSKFGEQVEDYACVYTSRVSNLLAYSPGVYFRSPREYMPHERP